MNLIKHKDGIYERRNLGNGFIGDVPSATSIREATPEMRWAGARIPLEVWRQVVAFFQWSQAETKSETQVRLLLNPATGEWKAHAFPQRYGTGMTTKELPDDPSYASQLNEQMANGFVKLGTVHHHCTAGAFQSSVDSADEKEMGIHVTVGNIGSERHSLHARVSLTIPGTLGSDGKMLTPARHAYYQAVLCDWLEVPEAPEAFPDEIREKITEWVLGTPTEEGHPFPAQWATNLIKEEVKVWPQQTHFKPKYFGDGELENDWGTPFREWPPRISEGHTPPPPAPVVEDNDEGLELRISNFDQELTEIQVDSQLTSAHIHGIMSLPGHYDFENEIEEVVHRKVLTALEEQGIDWETYIYETV